MAHITKPMMDGKDSEKGRRPDTRLAWLAGSAGTPAEVSMTAAA